MSGTGSGAGGAGAGAGKDAGAGAGDASTSSGGFLDEKFDELTACLPDETKLAFKAALVGFATSGAIKFVENVGLPPEKAAEIAKTLATKGIQKSWDMLVSKTKELGKVRNAAAAAAIRNTAVRLGSIGMDKEAKAAFEKEVTAVTERYAALLGAGTQLVATMYDVGQAVSLHKRLRKTLDEATLKPDFMEKLDEACASQFTAIAVDCASVARFFVMTPFDDDCLAEILSKLRSIVQKLRNLHAYLLGVVSSLNTKLQKAKEAESAAQAKVWEAGTKALVAVGGLLAGAPGTSDAWDAAAKVAAAADVVNIFASGTIAVTFMLKAFEAGGVISDLEEAIKIVDNRATEVGQLKEEMEDVYERTAEAGDASMQLSLRRALAARVSAVKDSLEAMAADLSRTA